VFWRRPSLSALLPPLWLATRDTAAQDSKAGVNPAHHLRSLPNHVGAKESYAFAPSVTRNGAVAASRPKSGCDNVFNYDRALDGYSYDLVCNGVDLSPH
jgi:hypothetical protein